MLLVDRIRQAKRVYIIGNGGSYANALHLANDLLSVGVKAYTLDPATMSMLANDYGWEYVFAHWIQVVGETGDLLIALSGSGKSPNILGALKMAKIREMDIYCEFGAAQGLGMEAAEEQQIHLVHSLKKELRDDLR